MNENLKYVYLKPNGNLSYYKEQQGNKELASVMNLNGNSTVNYNIECIILKEGIFKLSEDSFTQSYKRVNNEER